MLVCNQCDAWLGTTPRRGCLFCGHWATHWEPSPRDVAEVSEQVQTRWTVNEEKRRRNGGTADPYEIPVVTERQKGKRVMRRKTE